jgi:hypothetical protein
MPSADKRFRLHQASGLSRKFIVAMRLITTVAPFGTAPIGGTTKIVRNRAPTISVIVDNPMATSAFTFSRHRSLIGVSLHARAATHLMGEVLVDALRGECGLFNLGL